MHITSRSEYGMRAMILLAEQMADERLSATVIAERTLVPLKYLEQILRDLKRAGLVRSYAGVRGGYRLAAHASEVTAGQIVRAVDKDVMPVSCVWDDDRPTCELEIGCNLRPLWKRVQLAVSDVLDRTTLAQLAHNPGIPTEFDIQEEASETRTDEKIAKDYSI